MRHRIAAAMMAGGRRLAAQIVVSAVATGCAALVVPQVLARFADRPPVQRQVATLPASSTDFEGVFTHPALVPPTTFESALVDPRPVPAPAIAPLVPQRAASANAGQRVPERRRVAAPAPQPRPQEPLELTAMMAPQPVPAAAAPRPKILGMTLPRIPFEERIVKTVSDAREMVARVLN